MDQEAARTLTILERASIPPLSLVFGFGAMLPLAVGALATWLLPAPWNGVLRILTLVWGGSILCFLAGVRRGVSFRTEGGPRTAQIVTMLWIFALGAGSLAAMPLPILSTLLQDAGYVSIALLDPGAAERGEAPLFFARLRPAQMLIPVASLLALLLFDLLHH